MGILVGILVGTPVGTPVGTQVGILVGIQGRAVLEPCVILPDCIGALTVLINRTQF